MASTLRNGQIVLVSKSASDYSVNEMIHSLSLATITTQALTAESTGLSAAAA